jgi:hypothetical protein
MTIPYDRRGKPKRASTKKAPARPPGKPPSKGPKKARMKVPSKPIKKSGIGASLKKAIKSKKGQEDHAEFHHLYAHLRHTSSEMRAEGKRQIEEIRKDAERRLMQHTTQVEQDTSRIIGQVWKSKLPPAEKEGFLRQAREVLAHERQKMAHMEKGWLSKPAKKSLKQSEKRLKKEISAIDSQISKLRKAA